MSRKKSGDKLPPFTPLFRETAQSEAYRQLSFGARALFMALCAQHHHNNGHVYRSLREAGEDLGHKNRNDIANWFRELEHYGFIVPAPRWPDVRLEYLAIPAQEILGCRVKFARLALPLDTKACPFGRTT